MWGWDASPGDGVCATTSGDCPLLAAIEEANAAPHGADIILEPGRYDGADVTGELTVSVSGDVRISPLVPGTAHITRTTFAVEAGAHLALTGINTATDIEGWPLMSLDVAGTATIDRSFLTHLSITPGGAAVLGNSVVFDTLLPVVENDGLLLAVRSSLLGHDMNGSATDAVLRTGAGATTHLAASVIAQPHLTANVAGFDFPGGGGTCVGAAPTFDLFSFADVPAPCGRPLPPLPTQVEFAATLTGGGPSDRMIGFESLLEPTSPLVDAIPLGDPACDTSSVDVYGQARGVDGNGDGVGGCDVGAVERQP
jgi:hypothetical protein